MNGWKNSIILGGIFLLCFAGAIHGSHDQDKELLSFSIDSAKQVLAAILTITTVAIAGKRSTDKSDDPGAVLPTYPKQ